MDHLFRGQAAIIATTATASTDTDIADATANTVEALLDERFPEQDTPRALHGAGHGLEAGLPAILALGAPGQELTELIESDQRTTIIVRGERAYHLPE